MDAWRIAQPLGTGANVTLRHAHKDHVRRLQIVAGRRLRDTFDLTATHAEEALDLGLGDNVPFGLHLQGAALDTSMVGLLERLHPDEDRKDAPS
jgi:hypothetical protein